MPKPKGERTVVTRLRLPLALYKQIQRMAADEERTTHNLMVILMKQGYGDRWNHNSQNGASR